MNESLSAHIESDGETMTDQLAFTIIVNVAGWGFALLLATTTVALFALHTWMRTLERGEIEDDDNQ